LVVLAERLRPMAVAAVAYFQQQGVELKILSGDRPETVGAIASDVGIRGLGRSLDGESLPTEPTQLVAALRDVAVVGRISPEGKRRVVEALSSSGRYVAMVGDGVNDVPALKAARLAIAQGGGTQMAKSVADIVLVDGDFAAVPAMVAEGRKVLRNLQRVAKLFIAKSAFATFLILSVGLTPTAYPLLPRHLTLAASPDDRHPCLPPRPCAERRPLPFEAFPAGRRSLRRPGGCSRGDRRARRVSVRSQRREPFDTGIEVGRSHRARRDRPLPDRRARKRDRRQPQQAACPQASPR